MTPPRRPAKHRLYMVRVEGFGHVSQQRYRATSQAAAERKAREQCGIRVESHEVQR